MSYLGNNPEIDASVNKYEYTASSGQTTFSCAYDSRVDVYLNGVLLSASDYTANNGSTIVLNTGAALNDIVQIDSYQTISKNANSTDFGLFEHAHTIDLDYTIQDGNNAISAGPMTVNGTVTVPSGSTWTIV